MWFYHLAPAILGAWGICNCLPKKSAPPLHQLYPRHFFRHENQGRATFDAVEFGKGTRPAASASSRYPLVSLFAMEDFEDSTTNSQYASYRQVSPPQSVSKARWLRAVESSRKAVKKNEPKRAHGMLSRVLSKTSCMNVDAVLETGQPIGSVRNFVNNNVHLSPGTENHYPATYSSGIVIPERIHQMHGGVHNSPLNCFHSFMKKHAPMSGFSSGKRDQTTEEEQSQFSLPGMSSAAPGHHSADDKKPSSLVESVASNKPKDIEIVNFKNVLYDVGNLLEKARKISMARLDQNQLSQTSLTPKILAKKVIGEWKSRQKFSQTSGMQQDTQKAEGTHSIARDDFAFAEGTQSMARDDFSLVERTNPLMQQDTALFQSTLSKILRSAQRSAGAEDVLKKAWAEWRKFLIKFDAFSQPLIDKAVLEKVEIWLTKRATSSLFEKSHQSTLNEITSRLSEILKYENLDNSKQVIIQQLTQPSQEIPNFVKSASIKIYQKNHSELKNLVLAKKEIELEFKLSEESVFIMYCYHVFEKVFADSLLGLRQEAAQYIKEIIEPQTQDVLSETKKIKDILLSLVNKMINPPDSENHVVKSFNQASLKRLFSHYHRNLERPEEIEKTLRAQFNDKPKDSTESSLNSMNPHIPRIEEEILKTHQDSYQHDLGKMLTEEELTGHLMAETSKRAIDEEIQTLNGTKREELAARIMSLLTSKYLAICDEKVTLSDDSIYKLVRQQTIQAIKQPLLLNLPQEFLQATKIYSKEGIQNLLEPIDIRNHILQEFKESNPISDLIPQLQKSYKKAHVEDLETFKLFLNHINLGEGRELELEIFKGIKKISEDKSLEEFPEDNFHKKIPTKKLDKKILTERLLVEHRLFDHWYPKAEEIARRQLIHNDPRLKGTLFESLDEIKINQINSHVKALSRDIDGWLKLGRQLVRYKEEFQECVRIFGVNIEILWRILESEANKYAETLF